MRDITKVQSFIRLHLRIEAPGLQFDEISRTVGIPKAITIGIGKDGNPYSSADDDSVWHYTFPASHVDNLELQVRKCLSWLDPDRMHAIVEQGTAELMCTRRTEGHTVRVDYISAQTLQSIQRYGLEYDLLCGGWYSPDHPLSIASDRSTCAISDHLEIILHESKPNHLLLEEYKDKLARANLFMTVIRSCSGQQRLIANIRPMISHDTSAFRTKLGSILQRIDQCLDIRKMIALRGDACFRMTYFCVLRDPHYTYIHFDKDAMQLIAEAHIALNCKTVCESPFSRRAKRRLLLIQ